MKILMIGSKTSVFLKFRLDLVKKIISLGHEVVVISPEKDSSGILKKNKVKLVNISCNKTSLLLSNNIKYFIELIKIIKKEKPDKVFSYNIKPVIFGSIASKIAGISEIYPMITGLGYIYSGNSLKLKILQFIAGIGYKITFKFSKKVIFQNKDDMLEFTNIRKYTDISKCEVVDGSGVNMNEFVKTKLPTNISFLMVSRILELKGIKEYFEAAKIVKSKYPNTKFVFVGATDTSPLSFDIDKEFKEHINSGIVEFHKNSTNVKNFLKECSVFVLPSYYREGIPRAILEALSIGRPIITTDTIGCKEGIFEYKNGFLVKPKDANDLAEKMIYFLEHSDIIPIMSEESYTYCKKRFDVNIINSKILNILEIN